MARLSVIVPDVFETFWFTVLQHGVVALALPILVGYFCSRRSSWERLFIIVVCYLTLWVLWTALLSVQLSPSLSLLLSCLAVYTLIRSVARLHRAEPRK